jgi:hypothetical protein
MIVALIKFIASFTQHFTAIVIRPYELQIHEFLGYLIAIWMAHNLLTSYKMDRISKHWKNV